METGKTMAAACRSLLAAAACCVALCSCDGLIYDGEGDCTVSYRVRFRYDYNMKYADAFAHEVEQVTLYLLDTSGNVAWKKTESGEALAEEGYAMDVDVEPGRYGLLAWCGTADKGSFTIPEATVGTGLTCTLNRQRDADGTAYVDTDLDRLYHGYLGDQDFPEGAGTYVYTVPLVKNTNSVRVALQLLSGAPSGGGRFSFSIADDNGRMDWDNTVLEDETLEYRAWHTQQGEADISTGGTSSSYGTEVAELTTARLMADHATRLTVKNDSTGETVLSIPLTEYLLMVKGYYNEDMDDQEYLDRQDEYDMVFFLDEGDRWNDSYIYINSWRVVLQGTGL